MLSIQGALSFDLEEADGARKSYWMFQKLHALGWSHGQPQRRVADMPGSGSKDTARLLRSHELER